MLAYICQTLRRYVFINFLLKTFHNVDIIHLKCWRDWWAIISNNVLHGFVLAYICQIWRKYVPISIEIFCIMSMKYIWKCRREFMVTGELYHIVSSPVYVPAYRYTFERCICKNLRKSFFSLLKYISSCWSPWYCWSEWGAIFFYALSPCLTPCL